MKIQILGTGCYNCIKLETMVASVLKDLGKEKFEVVRVNDEKQIKKYIPLDLVPGLIIDDRLVCTKDLPDLDTLRKWLIEVKV